MDIQVKTLILISLSALFVTGCSTTNGGYATGQQVASTPGQKGVTHTHNGVAHTHPLPEGGLSHSHNYNTGGGTTANTCAPCTAGTSRPAPVVSAPVVTAPVYNPGNGGTQNSGNCHVHNGRRHCHPLPASGTNHTHQQGGGQTVVQPQQPKQPAQSGTTYYDYSGASATGSSYYNYGGSKGNAASNGVAHSHGGKTHTHPLPASGINHTHNQGATSIGNTYSTYANGGTAPAPAPASDGSTYIVKPKDTVFQVMRNTGVYWKNIIKLNNLQAPSYTIVPGQVLKLR